MRTLALSAFLAGLLGPLAVSAEDPDPFLMERLLPPGALLYLSIPQSPSATEDYAKSNLRALMEHPEVRSFLEPLETWWRRRKTEALPPAGPAEPSWNDWLRGQIGLSIDELWDLLRGPLAFALYDLPLNEEHKLDLVLGLGAPDAAKLQRAAGRLREAVKKRAGQVLEGEFTHGDVKIHELSIDEFRLCYGVVAKTLVATTTRERMEKILAAAGDGAPPVLRGDARFRDARALVAPDDRHLAMVYLDAAGTLRTFRKEIGDEGLKVLEALGVSDITSAAAAVAYDGPWLRERYALRTARQTRGILKFLSGGTPEDAAAALVPAGALSYAHFGLNLADLYDVVMAAGRASSPDFEEEVGKAMREYEARIGLGVREVLATVGTSWTEYSMLPEAGGAFPDSILAVTLADPAKFEAAVAKIAADARVPIEEMSFRGRKIRWITIGLGPLLPDLFPVPGPLPGEPAPFGFALSFLVHEGMLFLSGSPLALKRQILRLDRPAAPIARDPRYRALEAKAAGNGRESWSYSDFGRAFNILYSTLEPFVHLGRDFPRDSATGDLIVDLARLPLGEALADLIGATLTTKRTLPDAIVVESWSNTAVASTSGIATVAIALAVAIPAILYAEGERGGPAENERVALLTLHFIRQAQETFRNSDSDRNDAADYWTRDVAGLHALKDRSGQAIFLLDPGTAAADPEGAARYGLPPAPKNGYFFKAMATDADGESYAKEKDRDGNAATNKKGFGVAAYPAAYGGTGRLTFIISEEGKVYRKDTQGQPPDRWPGKDPAEQGWEKVD